MSDFTPDELKRCEQAAWAMVGIGVIVWGIGAQARLRGVGLVEYMLALVGTGASAVVLAMFLRLFTWMRSLGLVGTDAEEAAAATRRLVRFLAVYEICVLTGFCWLFLDEARIPGWAFWHPRAELGTTLHLFLSAGAVPWIIVLLVRALRAIPPPPLVPAAAAARTPKPKSAKRKI